MYSVDAYKQHTTSHSTFCPLDGRRVSLLWPLNHLTFSSLPFPNAMLYPFKGTQIFYMEKLLAYGNTAITYQVSSISVPIQNPQIKDRDNTLPLAWPPAKACTLTEPFAAPVGVGSAKRPVPMSKVAPPASRLTTVPEMVMPGAAGLRVTPSTMTKEECS